MDAAILASTPAVAAALRTVLEVLHATKPLDRRLDAMLCRLYEPILFRAFGAANAGVRLNALQLLVAAFPVLVSARVCTGLTAGSATWPYLLAPADVSRLSCINSACRLG